MEVKATKRQKVLGKYKLIQKVSRCGFWLVVSNGTLILQGKLLKNKLRTDYDDDYDELRKLKARMTNRKYEIEAEIKDARYYFKSF